jgi:hypothetical protein
VALLCLATSLPTGPAAAQGDDVVDEIVTRMPDDPDALTDEELATRVDEIVELASGLAPGSGDGSSELTGPCGGVAFSYDSDGALIDAAYDLGDDAPPQDLLDGGQAFTSGNPFLVDAGGRVTYLGFAPRSGDGPTGHDWSLSVGGVQVASGGDPNTSGKNRNAGTIDVADELPFSITAKFPASGSMTSSLPTCTGEGHVEIDGNGLLDIPGLTGIGLAAIGLAGLLFNARPARTWRH